MGWFLLIGVLLAIGAYFWIKHRGLPGVKSDIGDAVKDAEKVKESITDDPGKSA